jgi:phosphoribosylformylglycinamidine cyclo-ligase
MKKVSNYEKRGVSSGKEDVHNAIKNLDKGLFPGAFCKIIPDILGRDELYCNIGHADGAGTKSSLAYVYWKETGDLSVWKGIAQDAIVMNIDDLLCAGVTDEGIIYTSTIGRNKMLVPGEVISEIINGTEEFIKKLNSFGMNITSTGGETADIGDLVRTIVIDGNVTTRMKRSKVIVPNIQIGDSIVGFSSTGETTYEDDENSSIGSNGLTSARHDIFGKNIGRKYPESYDNNIDDKLVYCGKHNLTASSYIPWIDYGKLVLSPTRTYAPIILSILNRLGEKLIREHIHAIIHCSGGGQTKVLHFLNDDVEVVKNDFFPIPRLFTEIQKSANTEWSEMYKTFNMGHRMEIYCSSMMVGPIIAAARNFNVEAREIGFCIKREGVNLLTIDSPYGTFYYH